MGNIISYLDEFGGYTFVEKPLCEVDAMIFAYLTYISYKDSDNIFKISDTSDIIDKEGFMSVSSYTQDTRDMYIKIIRSRRFRNTRIMFVVNEIDKENDLQFSAMTFMLGNGDVVIAFRGTADEIVGWKEDFYIACKTPIPAQERSTEYVNRVLKKMMKKKNARFYLTGHSKGGNLAAYSAMTCSKTFKHRIGKIYNFDGPGFRPEFLEGLDTDSIKEKLLKYVPRESSIGMILQDDDFCKFEVVESSQIGILQHIPYTWCIEGDMFVRGEEDSGRKELYSKINEWILKLEKEKIGLFLDTLFGVVEGIDTVTELSSDWKRNSKSLITSYKDMDDEVKNIFWEFSVLIIELIATDQQERIKKWRLLNTVHEVVKRKDS